MLAVDVEEKNLSSLSLDGYIDKGNIVINMNDRIDDKIRTLCELMSEVLVEQTSIHPSNVKTFESCLLGEMLKHQLNIPLDYNTPLDLDYDTPNINGAFGRMHRASNFVMEHFTKAFALQQESIQAQSKEKKQDLSQNFMMEME